MNKLLTIVLLCSVSFVSFGLHGYAKTPTEKVIIVFKDEIDQKLVAGVNGEVEQAFKNVSAVAGEVPVAAIDDLERNKDVLAVEEDQVVKVNSQIQDWGIAKIHAEEAWKSDFTGQGVKIAILDTGIAMHDDLNVAGGVSLVPYTKSYLDDDGHGTHVAGIIGAKNNGIGTFGVAPDASLYAVKVLDQDGSGYLSDIIAGID